MRTIFHDFSEELFCFHRIYSNSPDAQYRLPEVQETQHFHEHYELCVAFGDQLEVISENGAVHMDRPCIVLNAPYSFHNSYIASDSDYECYVFHFNTAFISSFDHRYFDVAEIYGKPATVIPTEAFSGELDAILRLWKDGDEYANVRRLLLVLLLELTQRHMSSAISDYRQNSSRLSYVWKIISYIGSHYQEPLTADGISKEFFISRQKLDADFKRVMHTTLKQYILDVRTVNAVRMLSLGGKSVEVAYACGFVSESHFIRTFSQRIGMPPTRFSKNTGAVSDWDLDEGKNE